MPDLISKVKAILDKMPEADRVTVIKMYSPGSTDTTTKPPLPPRVQKLVDIFNALADDEKKMFYESTYGAMKGSCGSSSEGDTNYENEPL